MERTPLLYWIRAFLAGKRATACDHTACSAACDLTARRDACANSGLRHFSFEGNAGQRGDEPPGKRNAWCEPLAGTKPGKGVEAIPE